MPYIINRSLEIAHTGRNLRCLFQHAQRLRRKLAVPLFMTSDHIVLSNTEAPGSYRVQVSFCNGDTGIAHFGDQFIAGRFIKTWANKRGGTFHNRITGEHN